jgi:large subunit ribosomal protein L28
MAKKCQITGKGVLSGNNVSHANNKTRRRFYPNLRKVSFVSDALGRSIQLRLSTNAIRTIEFHGGLDAYVSKTAISALHPKIASIKKVVEKKQASK